MTVHTHGTRWAAVLTIAAGPMLGAACIPYTLGSTARPVARDSTTVAASWYAVSGGFDVREARDGGEETQAVPFHAMDLEVRRGIDDVSDMGVRVTGGSGLVLNYKRLLGDDHSSDRAATAIVAGAGIVNLGSHAHFELSLVTSARERSTLTPYGGLRAMQVAPLARGAVHDSPTAGGFVGARLGTPEFGVSPEVGVFYDRSALQVRRENYIVVPAITVHGRELIQLVGTVLGGARSTPGRPASRRGQAARRAAPPHCLRAPTGDGSIRGAPVASRTPRAVALLPTPAGARAGVARPLTRSHPPAPRTRIDPRATPLHAPAVCRELALP